MKNLIKNQRSERSRFIRRLIIGTIIAALLILLLLIRLFTLQVISHKRYATFSAQNAINLLPIAPQRGLIYDRHGNLLATNQPVYSLVVTPSRVKSLDHSINQLQTLIPISSDERKLFNKQLQQHRRFEQVPLKMTLSKDEMAKFEVNRWRFPGFNVQAQFIRYYLYGPTFAHAMGYVGRINDQELQKINNSRYAGTNFIGKTGIEKYYEPLLHGQVGYRRVEVDASGKAIRTLGKIPAKAGKNLYLTLDKGLQQTAENALGDLSGAVVVINVKNGNILAMVSTPSFNPNLFTRGISSKNYRLLLSNNQRPLYNRTIRGLYAPGSIVKPFIALEGLNAKVITPEFKLFDPGYFKLPHNNHIFHDWKRGGHGWVNVNKAIIQSCDTFFFHLGYKMGIDRIDEVLSAFNLGHPTGIDLPNELGGVLPSPKWKMKSYQHHWYPGDTVNTSIGQGYMLVTPLQMAVATATLSQKGLGFHPNLLQTVSNNNKSILTAPRPLVKIELNSPQTWQLVLSAMYQVISKEGTAWRFGHPKNYTAAAKTGTAQVLSSRFSNYKHVAIAKRPNSWFIVFAPYEDANIAMAVIVEHGPGKAAPIARKVADYFFAHKAAILATTVTEKVATKDDKSTKSRDNEQK
ncbi:MAG: penicillin-binding protein 2 [Gammaproteobacteria bacterium]|nr:penicillin-binding protein 2 [Gammaproteobacteria bacterium]